MTQAISVYISKTIFGPVDLLETLLNLEQQKKRSLYTQNTWCQSFVLHIAEYLWLFIAEYVWLL